MNKKLEKTYYKKSSSWIQALVILIFFLIPGLIMWYFLSGDWGKPFLSYGFTWMIAFAYIVYGFLICIFLIWIEVIWVDTFSFALPISIIMDIILVTGGNVMPSWGRAILVVAAIFLTFPINMYVSNLSDHLIKKQHLNKYKKN